MAHSIPTYKGRTVVINDLDLMVILGFGLQAISKSTQFENLQSLAVEWRTALDLYGPGCIDLKIDELLQTPTQVKEFATLLERVFQQASQYHEKIPADVVSKMVTVRGVKFEDYRVERVNEAVRKLQILIAER